MNGKRMFRLWMIASIWTGWFSLAGAAPPWGELIAMKSVDADPEKVYRVTESNGPWMVMACSFSGDGAEKQAKDLVLELRKRYKLQAYTYQGHFDPGEAQGRGVDEFGNPRKWNYVKYKDSKDKEKARHPELVETAVLVGNFRSADDPDGQAVLQKIKTASPHCLDVKEGQHTNQTLAGWRAIQRQVQESLGGEKKSTGFMGHAFITTNPSLPPEYFSQKNTVDDFIIALNKDVPYSLLDCQGKYTVQVATFKGNVVIKQDEIQAIQNGDKAMKSELGLAAEKADKLAQALRMKGYDAYQFHDHNASIVTVGSFDSVGTPRADGKIEINPEIHKIMKTFGAEATTLPGQSVPVTPLKTLVGIPFDIQPIPVQVPKRSFSMAFRSGD
jgi:hypothetical protein